MKLTVKKNIYDFNLNSVLNLEFWENESLKPNIKTHLLKIVIEFLNSLNFGVSIKDIDDIYFTGSLANYNYTRYSDVDLHVLFDFSKIDENEKLVEEFLMSKKNLWNNRHNIKIKGFEVEIYPQNIEETHYSTGVYSVLYDEWINKPKVPTDARSKINLKDIKKKATALATTIDNIDMSEDKPVEIKRIKEKIRRMRKSGLEKGGEYSTENLAFKVLRRSGHLEKLNDIQKIVYDKSFTLNGV